VNSHNKKLLVSAALISIAMFGPLLYLEFEPRLEGPQFERAVAPIFSLPLTDLRLSDEQATIELKIPDTSVDMKIRRVLGDEGYMLAVRSGRTSRLLCYSTVQAAFRLDRSALASEPPYGYSAECPQAGARFKARPGELVHITVDIGATAKAAVGSTDLHLVVLRYSTTLKDKLVGEDLSRMMTGPAVHLAVVGVVLELWLLMFGLSRRRHAG
jgi:hypothetical protein